MTGSHCDAIPHAGMYDGTVGVIGGIAAVKGLQDAGFKPKKSIEVLFFTSEEPTRFGFGCIGRYPLCCLHVVTLTNPVVVCHVFCDAFMYGGCSPVPVFARFAMAFCEKSAHQINLHTGIRSHMVYRLPVGFKLHMKSHRVSGKQCSEHSLHALPKLHYVLCTFRHSMTPLHRAAIRSSTRLHGSEQLPCSQQPVHCLHFADSAVLQGKLQSCT